MTNLEAAALMQNRDFQQSVKMAALLQAKNILGSIPVNLALWAARTVQSPDAAIGVLLGPLTQHPNVAQHGGAIPNDGDLAFAVQEVVPQVVGGGMM
jgi:hypothetical protein